MKLSQEPIAREGAGTLSWLGSDRTRQTSAGCFPLTWEPVSGVPGTELAETSSFSSCCLMQDQWGHKVSIIYVLIMDEPPFLLLQKALRITPHQADDAAGPLSAHCFQMGIQCHLRWVGSGHILLLAFDFRHWRLPILSSILFKGVHFAFVLALRMTRG